MGYISQGRLPLAGLMLRPGLYGMRLVPNWALKAA